MKQKLITICLILFTLPSLGNENNDKKLHYLNANVGYIKGSNRFEIGYGKKREGIFCVGGVCKLVPASNGFNFSVSSSF